MTYEKIFSDVKKSLMKADASKLEQEFAVQCNIQGEGEGSFYIAYKDGALSVEPYDYQDNNAQLYASGDTFMKMFAKKLDGKEAFEQGLLSFDGDVGVVLSLGNLQPKQSAKTDSAKKNPPKKSKPSADKKKADDKKSESDKKPEPDKKSDGGKKAEPDKKSDEAKKADDVKAEPDKKTESDVL